MELLKEASADLLMIPTASDVLLAVSSMNAQDVEAATLSVAVSKKVRACSVNQKTALKKGRSPVNIEAIRPWLDRYSLTGGLLRYWGMALIMVLLSLATSLPRYRHPVI